MNRTITNNNFFDENGNPAGGTVHGTGFCIAWQNGPLGRGPERKEPNGAFVEDVIAAAESRLLFYQGTKFACSENASAITHLRAAIEILNVRTKDRERRGVEGLNEL